MKKEMKYKVLLCLLAGSVLSANTALAAEYNAAILGAEDVSNAYDSIKKQDGNNYTYTFTEDSVLEIDSDKYGIAIGKDIFSTVNTDSIVVAGANLNINIINKQVGTDANGYAISIGAGQQNKIIDMNNNNGYINVNTESNGDSAGAYGVGLLDGVSSNNNKIYIGDSSMNLSAYNSADGRATAAGIYITSARTNHTIIMGDGQIIGKAVSTNDGAEAFGICDYSKDSNVQIGDVFMDISAEGNTSPSYSINSVGIMKYNTGLIKAGDGDILVTSKLNGDGDSVFAQGIEAQVGSVEKGAGNISVKATVIGNCWDVLACGIHAYDGAEVIKGNGDVTAVAQGSAPLYARGVFANNGVITVGISNVMTETIGGDNTSESIGLLGWNDGEINYAGGSITAVADSKDAYVAAIHAQDTAVINVNQGTSNDVVINGDINNTGNGEINLNLNTADSVLTGSIYDENGTLNLANGARWIATEYSKVNELTMNQGNIYVETPRIYGDVNISNYGGVGNILFKADDTDKEGVVNIDTSSVVFDDAEEGSFINVGIANNNIDTLDIDKTEENLNVLAGKVYYDGDNDNLNGKVVIKEGLITPEASGDLLFDTTNNNRGYVTNITGGNRVTKTMDAMKHIAETAIVAWWQEDSTLSQRLGDLRESDGGQGIWVRMSRGEFNYDSQYENQYNFFQLGYDWARGNWHYGAAVSHNDGETTYAQCMGENRSTSLSLYGTWLGRNGHYADIVLKQGRLSNDFDIYTEAGHTHGDYDMWGTSLSGEYGRKIDLKDGWYVTPQAQMTLMRIGGEDFTTNNGIHVRQDSLESAVGRVGFEVGKAFDKKGSIYAKVSLLHDFAGSADTYLSLKGLSNSYSQDIGDTWWEAGLGFNYKVNDSSYLYADVVKTFGGDVETPWQWNVGMRWAFV